MVVEIVRGKEATDLGSDQMLCSNLGVRHIHILHMGRNPVEIVSFPGQHCACMPEGVLRYYFILSD